MKVLRLLTRFCNFLCLALFVYLLIFPHRASEPTRAAIEFCARTLVPSLFVYGVLSKLIVNMPISDKIARLIGYSGFTLLIGLLCGAPLGAKTAYSLYKSRRADKKYSEFLCSFCNNASASFVIGFVGAELLGDIRAGVRLFVYQIISACLTACVMKRIMYGKEKLPLVSAVKSPKTDLREAISDSANAMIGICSCAVFFMAVGSALTDVLRLGAVPNALLKSLLEFSSGCAAAADLGAFANALCAFSIGFLGLSVVLQVKWVTCGSLSLKPYLAGKALSGSIITLLAVIFG